MMLEYHHDHISQPQTIIADVFGRDHVSPAVEAALAQARRKLARSEGHMKGLPPSPAPSASLEVKASAMRRYISDREGCRIQDVKVGMGLPQSDYEARRNFLISRGGDHMFYQLRTAGPTLLFTSKRAYDLWRMKQ